MRLGLGCLAALERLGDAGFRLFDRVLVSRVRNRTGDEWRLFSGGTNGVVVVEEERHAPEASSKKSRASCVGGCRRVWWLVVRRFCLQVVVLWTVKRGPWHVLAALHRALCSVQVTARAGMTMAWLPAACTRCALGRRCAPQVACQDFYRLSLCSAFRIPCFFTRVELRVFSKVT